jgi:S1-C subfamily serine protease
MSPSALAGDDPVTPDHGLQDGPTILQQYPNVYRALPAVYIIHTVANGTIECPTEVSCDIDDLDEVYDAAVQAGEIPADMPKQLFKWCAVAAEPDKYLRASAAKSPVTLQDTVVGHGTAYAVSREGILLTNRHVIDEQEITPLAGGVIPVGFQDLLRGLFDQLGAWEGDAELDVAVGESLTQWFARQSDNSRVKTHLAIAAAYEEEASRSLDAGVLAVEIAMKQFGFDTRQPILVPVEVVARGDASLVKDIAILRVAANVRDALICLSLADDAQVTVSAPIFSLGFPAHKYDLESGQRSGLFKVNVEPGEIKSLPSATFAARVTNRDVITLKAKLRPGCSGGPVILSDGRVGAMNVAHRQPLDGIPLLAPIESDGLAVPLAEIRSLLAAHQISLDPGPTTQLWNAALDDYLRGDRSAAGAKLRQVVAAQQVRTDFGQKPWAKSVGFPQPIANQYVEELLKLCQTP